MLFVQHWPCILLAETCQYACFTCQYAEHGSMSSLPANSSMLATFYTAYVLCFCRLLAEERLLSYQFVWWMRLNLQNFHWQGWLSSLGLLACELDLLLQLKWSRWKLGSVSLCVEDITSSLNKVALCPSFPCSTHSQDFFQLAAHVQIAEGNQRLLGVTWHPLRKCGYNTRCV